MSQVPQSSPQPVAPVCYRHPRRETHVRCTRCEKPICPDCMTEAAVGHQCPDCVAEGRRTQRSARTVFGGTAVGARGYATITLIAINVLVQIFSTLSAGGKGLVGGGGFGGLMGSPTPLTNWGAVVGALRWGYTGTTQTVLTQTGVAEGEYYRLFTAMFLQYGLLHLATNMWALWVIGRSIEAALGPVKFLALYLVAGLGGSVATYVFAPDSLTVGASGAIFGLFGAIFVLFRRLKQSLAPLVPLLVINLAISFTPGISLSGHLGGLVTGAAVAVAMAYAPPKRRALITSVAVGGLLLVMLFAVIAQTVALRQLPLVPPG